MAQQVMYGINPNSNLKDVVDDFSNQLAAFGFNVSPMMFGDNSANISIIKVGSDVEKFAGMLPEYKLTLTKQGENLYVNTEDVWTSKILACAVGWFLCGIGLVTGLIGVSRQSSTSADVQQLLLGVLQKFN